LLGLPRVPWQLPDLGVSEDLFLSNNKLLKAVPSLTNNEGPSTNRYLLFPSNLRTSVDDDIAKNEWRVAQALAYFLNLHILGLGWWAPSMEDDLGRAIKLHWHSGASLPLLDPKKSSNNLNSNPAFSIRSILLQDPSMNSFRPIQNSDCEFANEPFDWEIIPSSINWSILRIGQKKWTEIFNKEFAGCWRKLGRSVLTELGVSPIMLYQQQHTSPDLPVILIPIYR
jgi:hypothetical protein